MKKEIRLNRESSPENLQNELGNVLSDRQKYKIQLEIMRLEGGKQAIPIYVNNDKKKQIHK